MFFFIFIENFREIWFEFRENVILKIFAKIIEIFVFEPRFRMTYRNFAKEIERKFGHPIREIRTILTNVQFVLRLMLANINMNFCYFS